METFRFKGKLKCIRPATERMIEIEAEKSKRFLEPQRKFQIIEFVSCKSKKTITVTNKNRAWIAPNRFDVVYEVNISKDNGFLDLESLKIVDIAKWSNTQILDYTIDATAISKSKAEIILDFLNEENYDEHGLYDAITNDDDLFKKKLGYIKGIGETTFQNLQLIIKGQFGIDKLVQYLNDANDFIIKNAQSHPYCVITSNILKISENKILKTVEKGNASQDKILTLIQQNPYQFCKSYTLNLDEEIENTHLFSFLQADLLYLYMNDQADIYNEDRLHCFLNTMFQQIYENQRQTYVTQAETIQYLQHPEIIKFQHADPKSMNPEKIEQFLTYIEESDDFIQFQQNDDNCYSFVELYETEERIANYLIDQQEKSLTRIKDKAIQQGIVLFEQEHGFELTDEQKESIKQLVQQPLSVLTGFAGTGKSTIVSCAIQIFKQSKLNVLCCAFTGKAAQNLASIAKKDAYTIHKTIYASELHDENDKIKTNILIIDEISMCPMHLFNSLLSRLKEDTQLILLGDEGQLDPIQSINLLSEFKRSQQQLPFIALTKPQRQSEQSAIYQHSTYFRHQTFPNFDTIHIQTDASFDYFVDRDLTYFISRTNQSINQLNPNIFSATSKFIDFIQQGVDLKDLQIIAPRSNEVNTCNQVIQAYLLNIDHLNQNKQYKIPRKSITIHVGDRIINTKNKTVINEEEKPVYYPNGMIGTIIDIISIRDTLSKSENIYVYVETDDQQVVILEKVDLADIELAYAITVHKSQGSTIPHVIFVSSQNYIDSGVFLNCRLAYTAITRAKKTLSICCNQTSLQSFIVAAQDQKANLGRMIEEKYIIS